MNKKIVVFGAGATGRGHVGLLAWQAGFEIVFVDKKKVLVDLLRSAGRYKVRLFGDDVQEIDVSDYRVYHSAERQAIAGEIADAVLVLTAVFDPNLADVAKTVALAASICRARGRDIPLNFIACENMMESSSVLGKHAHKLLDGPDLAYAKEYFGFPDCMISRIVPQPKPDPLVLVAEAYNEWTARAQDFKGKKPIDLTSLELVDNQPARLERKLFIHNGGHAICGYFGFHRNHAYIHEAVADSVVAEHVKGALDEIGEVVRRKHGFSAESIDAYKADLIRRGGISEIADEILRVVRDPIRKLSPQERLVAPALLAVEYGLPRHWIIQGIVAALRYKHPDDSQSMLLAKQLDQFGLAKTLQDICQIERNTPLEDEILKAWRSAEP